MLEHVVCSKVLYFWIYHAVSYFVCIFCTWNSFFFVEKGGHKGVVLRGFVFVVSKVVEGIWYLYLGLILV
jgi:hypothetical protein